MRRLLFLFTLMPLSSHEQENGLDIDKYLKGRNRVMVDSFLNAGHRDFIFVDRSQAGRLYEKYNKCAQVSFLKFILIKVNNSNDYEFIKYGNCTPTHFTGDSKALLFFEENRDQIRRDEVEKEALVLHQVNYLLYEFRDGRLTTFRYFCQGCIDLIDDESLRNKNQELKLCKFFSMLDGELSGLID